MNETAQLKDKVVENLMQDSRLADYPIDVLNNNGVITLTGEVSSQELSDAAEAIARHTDGAITVINEIVINSDAKRTRVHSTLIPPK
jgi:osmotically-inducible protein OsmY